MKTNKKNSLNSIKKKFIEKTFGLASNITEVILLISSSIPYIVKEPSMSRVMENIAIIWDGYDPKRLRESLFTLKKRKYLDKNYQLTQQGWGKIKSFVPGYQKATHWDGNWYLVVFDVPEYLKQKRNALREKLVNLGFGLLQKSVWLSSYNYLKVIEELVGYYHINNYILTIITTNISNQDDKLLAQRVWHLDKVNKLYQEFIQKHRKSKKTDILAKFFYLSILKQDPQLPIELLPESWRGQEAAKIAKKRRWIKG